MLESCILFFFLIKVNNKKKTPISSVSGFLVLYSRLSNQSKENIDNYLTILLFILSFVLSPFSMRHIYACILCLIYCIVCLCVYACVFMICSWPVYIIGLGCIIPCILVSPRLRVQSKPNVCSRLD